MNILFYQDTLGVSGGEIWVVDAATRLRELGHGVSIACPAGSWVERQAENRGFPWVDFSADPGYEAHQRWVLAEHMRRHEVDLIFCSVPGMRSEVPMLDDIVRRVGRGRIVVRLGVAPGRDALAPSRVGVGYPSVAGIIAVSHDVKKHLVANVSGVDPDAVHVIYNGVDADRFGPARFSENDRAVFRDRLEVPQGDTVVTTIGRLDPIKNLPMLIDAAEILLQEERRITFLIAGDGAQADVLQRVVKEKGLERHFRFPGFVEDVPRLLHASDVLAHCALSEGVPNVVLEGMAAGLAVVATDVGGVSEVVEDGQTGVIVPSADAEAFAAAILGLIEDEDWRAGLGREAAAEVATAYSRARNIQEVERLLTRIASEVRPVPAPPDEGRRTWSNLKQDVFAHPVFRQAAYG